MSEIYSLLYKNNPFVESVAREPWVNDLPIVESINQEVLNNIQIIIEEKKVSPNSPLALVITGDVGFGKTHFIKRILDVCSDNNSTLLFSYIRPILNEKNPIHTLLKRITTNLSKKIKSFNNRTQLHKILYIIILTHLQKIGGDISLINRFMDISSNTSEVQEFYQIRDQIKEEISDEFTEINLKFLDVLFQYPELEKRKIVMEWLKGELLDDEDYQKLGLNSHRKEDSGFLEEESADILISLGYLLSKYNITLLVCFDQIENLETDDQIKAYSLIIDTLVNHTPAIFPITVVRDIFWVDEFKPRLDDRIKDRLDIVYKLDGCTLDQAKEIIKLRIQYVFPDWSNIYEQFINDIISKIPTISNPREVISIARNYIIKQPKHPKTTIIHPLEITEYLKKYYKSEQDKILANLDEWPADSDDLREALKYYLKSKTDIIEIIENPENGIDFGSISNREGKSVFLFNTFNHWKKVNTIFQNGIHYLSKNPDDNCWIIVDPRCRMKSGWKVAGDSLKTFKELQGIVLEPDTPHIARWYALLSMILKIKEGTIEFETNQSCRTVTEEEFKKFIQNNEAFGPSLLDISKISPKHIDCKTVIEHIITMMKDVPIPVITTDNIIRYFSESNIIVTESDIVECSGKHESLHIIEIYQGIAVRYLRNV